MLLSVSPRPSMIPTPLLVTSFLTLHTLNSALSYLTDVYEDPFLNLHFLSIVHSIIIMLKLTIP
jgi:hypothetical protein